jgi:hypothetical protein
VHSIRSIRTVATVFAAAVICDCPAAQPLPPPDSYTTTPDVESCRLTFVHSYQGWYLVIPKTFVSGSYLVAVVYFKLHATPDDQSEVREESRSFVMREMGIRKSPIGERIDGRKIEGVTEYSCLAYQWKATT